jgi:hypothetical protein
VSECVCACVRACKRERERQRILDVWMKTSKQQSWISTKLCKNRDSENIHMQGQKWLSETRQVLQLRTRYMVQPRTGKNFHSRTH